MQLRHLNTLTQPATGDGVDGVKMSKVMAVAWAPNNRKLAVCTADRVVSLYDENGEKRDRFSTKPAEKGPKNYIVRDLRFSPDSTRLAVAQSDCIVFVYKLGLEWGESKSICNKFPQSSPITCMSWPEARPNEVVFGLAEGKVKIGQLKSNKPATLYNVDSFCASLATSPDGNGVVSAHADGTLYRFLFDDNGAPSHTKLVIHPSVPYALSWGVSIVAAGNDGQVVFYDMDGGMERTFDYSSDSSCREFTTAAFNPTGDAVVLGNYDSFHVFAHNHRAGTWEEAGVRNVENMYTVTALGWRADGSRLAVGSLCGSVDIYDACVKRTRYKGRFELTYVSLSQVIVKRLSSGSRIVLKSHFACEISRVNIYQDRFVVANTTETLLLGDLETLKLSEIPWQARGGGGSGGGRGGRGGDGSASAAAVEKFIFDSPSAALVYHASELSIIEYGRNEILGAVRTEHISAHLLSVCLSDKPPRRSDRDLGSLGQGPVEGTKTVAHLLDAQTINIKDLITNATSSISHDSKVDWLELNSRADLLLFRDRRRRLHLYNIRTQTRGTLLSYCTYVQWVPDSDVVVAQNRGSLCVWYNIHAPDQVTTHDIKGEVYEIERLNGCTEVIVNEGYREASYVLDEALIRFGGALDDGEYALAVSILEPLEVTPEAAAMWQQLGSVALEEGDISTAERCAAALGDVSRARFLHKVSKSVQKAAGSEGRDAKDMQDHWSVRYRLALLRKDVQGAEDVLVSQGKVEEAIAMRHGLHQYEEALALGRAHRLPEERLEGMAQEYFRLLLDTKQEERAAALKEKEGDFEQAIRLYLKGGLPAQAGRVLKERTVDNQGQLLETVASTLSAAGMHDKAGEFYEEMNQLQRAMDSYTRGNAFRQAVELARRSFPAEVVDLQEMWGDYLMTQKQVDMAINHYIEARANGKAVGACLTSRQWSKAAQLVETLDGDSARPHLRALARHHEEAGNHALAERFFVDADAPQLAVEMYTKANRWEAAHKLASSYMSEGEVRVLYMEQAQKMEAAGSLLEAEKLYLQVGETDLAIAMYKKAKRFDAMVRLVAKHRPDVLKETHQYLAQQLEMDGSLKEAEHHYAEAGEWLSAVNMYRSSDMWNDALRVAKFHGGQSAHKRVAYAWALALGGDAGAKLLNKQGLIEPAIEYATESGAFDHALELAQACCPAKLPGIHLKHALFLEDEERFKEAEEEFLQAGKPREAIDMFVHQKAWADACRVAEGHDPPAVSDVLCAQAADVAAAGDRAAAEELFVRAAKPEKALQCYEEAGMWRDALRVCQRHLPHLAHKVHAQYQAAQALTGTGGAKADYLSAGRALEQNRDWSGAIDAYLKATQSATISGDDLEEVWERAITVARVDLPNRHMVVVREVSRRLADMGRHEAAAEVLRAADQPEEAVAVAVAGGAWEKARESATGHIQLSEKVESAYQQHLMRGEATEELLQMGQTNAALDILAQKGEWDRLWESAAKQGSGAETLAKYAGLRVRSVLDDEANWERPVSENEDRRELDDAVLVLEEKGAPPITSGPGRSSAAVGAGVSSGSGGPAADMYERLVKAVLARDKDASARPGAQKTAERLLRVLQAQTQNLKALNKTAPAAFENILMATHYTCLMGRCRAKGGKDCLELASKVSITLLRYSDFIPCDKCFYQAGSLCKDLGNENLAFVLLNRYVDLTEAIDEGSASLLDNSDFAEATNVPLVDDRTLPTKQHIPVESEREEVRDWVLSVCMDAKIDQALPPEKEAGGTLYQGLYASELPSCVVTGLPVHKRDLLQVNNARANKRDWNAYVRIFRRCPWTGVDASPQY